MHSIELILDLMRGTAKALFPLAWVALVIKSGDFKRLERLGKL
jgi:hypothetical protein